MVDPLAKNSNLRGDTFEVALLEAEERPVYQRIAGEVMKLIRQGDEEVRHRPETVGGCQDRQDRHQSGESARLTRRTDREALQKIDDCQAASPHPHD